MTLPDYIYRIPAPSFMPSLTPPDATLMKLTPRGKREGWPEYENSATGPVDQIRSMCLQLNKTEGGEQDGAVDAKGTTDGAEPAGTRRANSGGGKQPGNGGSRRRTGDAPAD